MSLLETPNFTMENMTKQELCQLARAIIDPPWYKAILMGECVLGLLAIVPNILLISVIWKVTILPANLRVLLGHFSLVFSWFSIGATVKSMYLLTSPICGFKLSSIECKILDLIAFVLVLPNTFYTLVAICVERLYATLRYKKYDQTAAKNPWLSLLLIVFSWFFALGVHATPALRMAKNIYVPTCEVSFVSVASALVYEIYLSLEILSVALTIFVYMYTRFIARNMSINRARYDLSSRFQVEQNVRVNAIMFSSVILHVICHIPTFIAMIGIRGREDISYETRAWLTQITYLWRLAYALAHPILAFRFNQNLRQRLHDHVLMRFKRSRLIKDPTPIQNSGPNQAAQHFDILHKLWLEPSVRRTMNKSTAKMVQKQNTVTAKF